MFWNRQYKDKIVVVDSTEKCAGTSIKQLLRENFAEDNMFDYDNGDPPSMKIRNYGIKCDIFFQEPKSHLDFYDEFHGYLARRGKWLSENHLNYDLRCVYGNGLFSGKESIKDLLKDSKKELMLNKFLRRPVSRLFSEYSYVLKHTGHNLHPIAKEAGDFKNYLLAPDRPKNRMCASIQGPDAHLDGDVAFETLKRDYTFVGFVETFEKSVKAFAKVNRLKVKRKHALNSTPTDKNSLDEFSDIVKQTDAADCILYDKAFKHFSLSH